MNSPPSKPFRIELVADLADPLEGLPSAGDAAYTVLRIERAGFSRLVSSAQSDQSTQCQRPSGQRSQDGPRSTHRNATHYTSESPQIRTVLLCFSEWKGFIMMTSKERRACCSSDRRARPHKGSRQKSSGWRDYRRILKGAGRPTLRDCGLQV
jgi:hypothetical protein